MSRVSTSRLATGTQLRKHLAEGATLVSTVEAGEGVGERTGVRLQALSVICQGLLANPGHTSWKSENLQAQRVKETVVEFVDESATPFLGKGASEQATLEQHWLGHAWGWLNPDQNRSLK